jgi:hypothetical protein
MIASYMDHYKILKLIGHNFFELEMMDKVHDCVYSCLVYQ